MLNVCFCNPVSTCYDLKFNSKNNKPKFPETKNFAAKNISFGNNYAFPNLNVEYFETDKGLVQAARTSEIKEKVALLDLNGLWEELNRENEQKQYIKFKKGYDKNAPAGFPVFDRQEIYKTSPEAKIMLERLDGMNKRDKAKFIALFCDETGFPSFEAVTDKMENEIQKGAHKLADENNFSIKFIGYDSNCSVGRKCPLPGKDCDGLFIIIEPPENSPEWFAGAMRWNLKDVIRQRIVSTPSNHLPELLTTEYIEQGLNIASDLFNNADFTEEDLARFKENIQDNSKDFVKSAEFNIRLAKKLPVDARVRDKFYKTAMFVEIVRDGRILENEFSPEFMKKVKNSPLYEYSNIVKEQGFKNLRKRKHKFREKLVEQFGQGTTEEQYQIIRDILHSSLGMKDAKNKECFTNDSENGTDEMGNILEMYDILTKGVE